MSSTSLAVAAPYRPKLRIELARFQGREEVSRLVSRYAAGLLAELAVPHLVSADIIWVETDAIGESFFRILVDGERRRRLWPRPIVPDSNPAPEDRAALLSTVLYDMRELLLTESAAQSIATECQVAERAGYDVEVFLYVLRAFLKCNLSLERARKWIETRPASLCSSHEAAYVFEDAVEHLTIETAFSRAAAPLGISMTVSRSCALTEEKKSTEFIEAMNRLTDSLGIACPELRIHQSNLFEPPEFQIQLNDIHLPVMRGLQRDEELRSDGNFTSRLFDPLLGWWWPIAERGANPAAGVGGYDVDYLRFSLARVIRGHADSLLASPTVYLALEPVQVGAPTLVSCVKSTWVDPPRFLLRLTAILRRLLSDQLSVLDLAGILQSFLSLREVSGADRRVTTHQLTEREGATLVMAAGRGLAELTIDDYAQAARTGARLAGFGESVKNRQLIPFDGDRLTGEQLLNLLHDQPPADIALVVRQEFRSAVRDELRFEFPTVTVLGSREVPAASLAAGYYSRGTIRYQAGAFHNASRAYREAACLASENAGYHAYAAYALASEAEYTGDETRKRTRAAEAAKEYWRAIALEPRTAWFHRYRSFPLKRLDRWDEAATELRMAIRFGDKSAEALGELAACLCRLGKFGNAAWRLRISLANHPGLRTDLANVFILQSEYRQALDTLASIPADGPSATPVLIAALQTVIANPDSADAYAGLGRASYDQEYWMAAAAAARRAVAIDPLRAEYHKQLGSALYKLNDWSGAASAWKTSSNLQPEALTFNNLGTAYDALKKSGDAIACYEKAAELSPDQFVPQYNLGSAYYRLARFTEARDFYRKARDLFTKAHPEKTGFAPPDGDDAAHAAAGEGAHPENAGFAPVHFNLGTCHFRLGHRDEAMTEWTKAVEIDSKHVDSRFNLGVALWTSEPWTEEGRVKASACWSAALADDPNLFAAEANLEAMARGKAPPWLEIFDLVRPR